MKSVGCITFCLFAVAEFCTLQASDDQAALAGVWIPQKIIVNGKNIPKNELKKIKLTVKNATYAIADGGKLISKGGFSLNSSKKPKQIDITAVSPDGKKKRKVLGIYKLEGEVLTVCGAASGAARPGDFTAKAGSMRELVVYRRQKR